MGRLFNDGYDKGPIWAEQVWVDTSTFTGNLSSLDDTLQKALETIDQMSGGGSTAWDDLTGTPTALLLDQTIPQSVINGTPTFEQGVFIGDGDLDFIQPLIGFNEGSDLVDRPYLGYVGGATSASGLVLVPGANKTDSVLGLIDKDGNVVSIFSSITSSNMGVRFLSGVYGEYGLVVEEDEFCFAHIPVGDALVYFGKFDANYDLNLYYNLNVTKTVTAGEDVWASGRMMSNNGTDAWLNDSIVDITTDVGLINPARSIDTDGAYLYLGTYYENTGNCPFQIYSLADPANPVKISPTTITGIPEAAVKGIKYRGGYVYIAIEASGGDAFRIVDVTDPTAPVVVGGSGITDFEEMGGGTTLDIEGDYAFVTSGRTLYSIDISNKAAPVLLDSLEVVPEDASVTLWTCKVFKWLCLCWR
jgi:Uncharacterized conserved protein